MHGFGVLPAAWARDVRVDDRGVEVLREVEDEVVDAELLGDAAGVVDVGHAAAPGVALPAPQPHRDADDLVTVARQQRGGDGRVDAAAHRDHHLHGRAAMRRRNVAHGRRDRRDRRVDVGLRRRAPEREAQRARCPRPVDAHRGEHVRRIHRPARARRCGGRADAVLVEQVQQRLALDPLDEDVRRAGDLVAGGDRLAEAGHAGGEAGDEAVAQRRRCARHLRRPLGVGRRQRDGEGDDAADVVGAAAPIPLLAATDDERVDGRAVAHGQHAHALRTAELVGAQRQQVDVRPQVAEVEPAGRLHGVGVDERVGRVLADQRGDAAPGR